MSDKMTLGECALARARDVVYGTQRRSQDYGDFFGHMTLTGKLWAPVLAGWAEATNGEEAVPPDLIPICMNLDKIARSLNGRPIFDSPVDMIGWAAGYADILERQGRLGERITPIRAYLSGLGALPEFEADEDEESE